MKKSGTLPCTAPASVSDSADAVIDCESTRGARCAWLQKPNIYCAAAQMKSVPASRPQLLRRSLSRRSRALAAGREESSFRPLLRYQRDAPELLLSPHWDDAVLGCW